jgi:hypothetical protein
MAKPNHLEYMRLYVSILEEVKQRIENLNVVLDGRAGLNEIAAVEFCYLQIRFICELIALGCLTVHGDLAEAASLKKVWAADAILKRLEQLNPQFYPYPVVFTFPKPGHVHLEDFSGEFLTRDEFPKLLGLTGDVLHKGSLRNLLRPNEVTAEGLGGVRKWGQKLVNLINQHRIGLIGGNHIVCALKDQNGNVNVSFAQGPS